MINIEINIQAVGHTNINRLKEILMRCDDLRGCDEVSTVTIAMVADNVSSLIQNSLNSCTREAKEDCNITLEELTDDLEN